MNEVKGLMPLIPTNAKEMKALGWEQADVILITGDAFIDHPAFGTAIIAHVLMKKGFKVAVIPQPNWKDDLRDFKKLGEPRLFFGVSAGNMDSMIYHYTAHKRLRSEDAYTPGGKNGFRPDRAVTVYSKILKSIFPTIPVIIGGIEASLRRIAHYDYWDNELKPSILVDSGADVLVYGMAEKPIIDIANYLSQNKPITELQESPQMAFLVDSIQVKSFKSNSNYIELASFQHSKKSKTVFAESFKVFEEESNKLQQKGFIQQQDQRYLIINPPLFPLSEQEMDDIYSLPYTYQPHPKYAKKEPIPAFEMIKNSVTIHRGCFGGCSFCALTVHQGKFISSRSEQSIIKELNLLAQNKDFKGHISDLGAPSANMYKMRGINPKACKTCIRPSCIFPSVCANLNDNPEPLIQLYQSASQVKGIKKISIGSGVRYDMHLNKKSPHYTQHKKYLEVLVNKHVSGRLKVAPEHTEDHVLALMRKPSFAQFNEFMDFFYVQNGKSKLNQQIIPYFISSHPGCKLTDMKQLHDKVKKMNIYPEQVQDFIPLPMTLSGVIFYSGINPYSKTECFVERDLMEKKRQKEVFFKKRK